MIGKTLGHYQITSQLGKGGMGEVYQAKDQKLGREVAIKVLPKEFAQDADRVARFQREAKLLASLNHPNIAAIHGLEESGGTNFLVLELVEGETLADQIKRGPIPVEESLKLALQIAEALEAAHEKGVIHRDLKPSNIKVTPDGKVKVLDFGLAKAYAGEHETNLSDSPTLSDMATQQGVILGTAAYMSPEQARGQSVDGKADIWAFGVVLYEMMTGRAMFEGHTVSDTLAAVLMREPDWTLLPHNLQPRIRLLLERCLEKESRNRCSGMGDVRGDILKALADSGGVSMQPVAAVESPMKQRTRLPWIAAVLGIGIGGVAVWNLKPVPPLEPRPVTRVSYELPEGQQFGDLFERAIAVSADGSQLVYATNEGLHLRSMDGSSAKLLAGTEGTRQRPFFSPDGKWIGFFSSADNKLKKIAISGGAPVPLAEINVLGTFDWGADDTILYGQPFRGIMRVSANGGTPEQIIKSAENENFVSPQLLPDGKSVLFTELSQPFKMMVQSLESGQREELLAGDSLRYLPTGHLVYAVGNDLFAIPFDPQKLKISGIPLPVVAGVRPRFEAQYAVSNSGTLFYVPVAASGASYDRTIVWVDRDGKEEPSSLLPKSYSAPRISPDGRRVALGIYEGNREIWIWDLIRGNVTRLTYDPGVDDFPLWTSDGKRIAFHTDRNGGSIYWTASDGTGKEELFASVPGREILPFSLWRDGKSLVSMEINLAPFQTDVGLISMEGDHLRKLLLQASYNESYPEVSPDGRWLAYASNESGKYEVYVRSFPDVDKSGKCQVSTNGGDSPLWSPKGRELFYRSGDSIMSAIFKTEPTFSVEESETLFRGTYVSANLGWGTFEPHPWDISPDGKRFLMLKQVKPASGPRKIEIVLNWFEELKQRLPAK